MTKNSKQLKADTEKFHDENLVLGRLLTEAVDSIEAMKTENVDALVASDEKKLKVLTEITADKPYRILIEKMHEGAVTINEKGTILYSNSYFANMVKRPLQKVIGSKFEKFIDGSVKEHLEAMLIQNGQSALKEEVYIYSDDGKKIPALMTINALNLEQTFVLSIILTDLTVQYENQERLKRRTTQLEQKNEELENAVKVIAFQTKEKENRAAELLIADKELEFQSGEKEKLAAELIIADKELVFQTEEKGKRAAELIIANKELAFQNSEKGKRSDELQIANKELVFQNDEKEKRAAELIIANKELAFQINEKGKRADELQIANKELVFQNDEKEKRAAELIIANKELVFQNEEKRKRAAELIIADKELEFQSGEKEKRAEELIIADKELEFQSGEKEKRAEELIVVQKNVKELEELNIHKESILATLSHDLRSPLGAIIGIADYLKSDFDNMEPSEVKMMINVLLKASTEELNMLDYLVEWARIKYASEAFTPSKIKLVQYVKKVLNILNKNATANDIQLDNEIEKDIFVFADEKMLLSILQNIVSNSIKHTPAGGKVTFSAKKSGDKIIVEIKDTGIGMSNEMQKNLFAPQMKALSNSRKENKGAGIGLLLVNGFIEKHGGEIWVESVEGKGSSFYFTLPANKPAEI